jgi:hypothetical protein
MSSFDGALRNREKEEADITEEAVKEPVKTEPAPVAPKPAPEQSWSSLIPFKALRREVERLFEDFDKGSWRSPFRSNWSLEPFLPGEIKWASMPSVNVAETDCEPRPNVACPLRKPASIASTRKSA